MSKMDGMTTKTTEVEVPGIAGAIAEIEKRNGIVGHTPGPWKIRTAAISGDRNSISITSNPASRNVIFHQWDHGNTPLQAEDYANARLIAAAPELLAALKEMVEQYDGDDGDGRYEPQRLEREKAIIAKAEGKWICYFTRA